MIREFNELTNAAVDRYGSFLSVLRAQSDAVFRRDPTSEAMRNEALKTAQSAARTFLVSEQVQIEQDSRYVALSAQRAALTDMGYSSSGLTSKIEDFVLDSAYFTSRILAAQAERDVIAMAQHIQNTALRVDLYARSGRHTVSSAAAQVMIEDRMVPAFRFVDRMGRKFKASKHIRDTYRMHLLNIYNEVYMDTVATYGRETVRVYHPNPDYKWFGAELLIVTGGSADPDLPLYYDVREEIFHPSSDAVVTVQDLED